MSDNVFVKNVIPRINNILAVSEYRKSDILSRHGNTEGESTEDYTFGWKEVIEYTIEKSQVDGLLLSGKDGCGKHTAAEIAIAYLAEKYQYEPVFLSSEDFCFSETEIKADETMRQKMIEQDDLNSYTDDIYHSFMETVFNEFDYESKICLILDNTSEDECMGSVYKRLEKYLCIYSQSEQFPLLFAIIIEKDTKRLSSTLLKRLRTMYMSCPNINQRQKILTSVGLESAVAAIIAGSTEGLTYAQLRDIGQNLDVHERVFDITGEFYNSFIDSQTEIDNVDNEQFLLEEKIRLYQKLESLIDNAPQLFEKLPTGTYVSGMQEASEQNTEDQDSEMESYEDLDNRAKEIEKKMLSAPEDIVESSKKQTLNELLIESLEDRIKGII